jgi:DNA repair protein RadD
MAAPPLRPHQVRMRDDLRACLQQGHRAVIVQGPTGSGKGTLIAAIAAQLATGGRQVVVVAHLAEINHDLFSRIGAHDLPVRLVMGDVDEGPADAPITVTSIQTVEARGLTFPGAAYILLDEAHRAASPSVQSLISRHPDTRVIGFTATPGRADGRALEHFTAIVHGPQVRELVAAGLLAPITTLAPAPPSRASLAQDPVEAYQPGRPTIIFAMTVDHSKHLAFRLADRGVRIAHLDGTTPRGEREATLAAFADGTLEAITNYRLLVEGVDVPRAEVCLLAAQLSSPVAFLQAVGRVRRALPGKQALLLDLAGNIHAHGLPDDDRSYHLSGDAIRVSARTRQPQQCGTCLSWGPPASACPCGAVRPQAPLPRIKARDLIEHRAREPEAMKWAAFERMVAAAVRKGRKPASAIYIYKGTFGTMPPKGWLDAIIRGDSWAA